MDLRTGSSLEARPSYRSYSGGQPAALPREPACRQPCAACAVRGVCLTAGLDEGQLRALDYLPIGRRRVRKGQVLYHEGDAFLFIYAVRSGSFKSTVMLRESGQQVTGFHLRGELMGFDGTARGRHPVTATALEESIVCAVPYGQLMGAVAGIPTLQLRVMQIAGNELVRARQLSTLVASTHAAARVAAFLLDVSARMRERGYGAADALLRMSRTEMASYLGTTQATVSRCLASLARRGLITLRKRTIQLRDVGGLKEAFEAELP